MNKYNNKLIMKKNNRKKNINNTYIDYNNQEICYFKWLNKYQNNVILQ